MASVASQIGSIAATITLRDYFRTGTALLALFPVILLWIVGLALAQYDLAVWAGADPAVRLFAMALVLAVMTVLSLLPFLIWATFDSQERQRIHEQAQRELENHGWKQLTEQIDFHYAEVHAESRYRVPVLTVTLVTMFGWTLLIFSNGPGVITVLFETGSLNEFLNLISQAHPVAYGFFGAYLFVIGMMIRRYHRSDLSPSIFMSAVYQIWAAGMVVFIVAIAWVLVFGEDTPTGTAVELLAGGHKTLGSESLMGLIIVSFASGIAPWPTLRDIRLFAATARRRVFASKEDHDEAIVKPRMTELQGLTNTTSSDFSKRASRTSPISRWPTYPG